MNSTLIAFVIGIGLSAITVFADMLIKQASLQKAFSGWRLLVLGAFIYALTALGWFFVMRKIKLSTLGVLYGVSCIILLALISTLFFKEKLFLAEILAIILAILSLFVLSRFA
ncbi:MAG TPA: transporter [Candidatus Paceibacterota bacterium]|nr:transporter [Candidatus Paceibacterota bacterium]HRZ34630.1 transporter [Candidatus Paceibacterota bacterium]